MSFFLGVLLGMILALLLVWGVEALLRAKKKRKVSSSSTPRPVVKTYTYGHPYDPVSTIRNRLPDVAYPFAWETWKETLNDGHVVMRVTLRNLKEEKELERVTVKITRYSAFAGDTRNQSWESYYHGYKAIGHEYWVKYFESEFITPAMDEIKLVWRKHTQRVEGPTDYKMQA